MERIGSDDGGSGEQRDGGGAEVRHPVAELWLEMGEGLLIGIAGTAAGLGMGAVVLRWVVGNIATSTMPDLHLEVALSAGTVLTALSLGVLAVGIAPLLSIRRLRRMDIPGTLRVVE